MLAFSVYVARGEFLEALTYNSTYNNPKLRTQTIVPHSLEPKNIPIPKTSTDPTNSNITPLLM